MEQGWRSCKATIPVSKCLSHMNVINHSSFNVRLQHWHGLDSLTRVGQVEDYTKLLCLFLAWFLRLYALHNTDHYIIISYTQKQISYFTYLETHPLMSS